MTDATGPWILHGHPMSGPTYKVQLLLSLAGIPVETHAVDLRAGEQRTETFRAKTPFLQVPVLEHAGRCITQSASILEYVAAVTGRFGATDEADRAEIRAWMFWEFDRLGSTIARARTVRFGILKVAPETLDWFMSAGDTALGLLEAHLAAHDWLALGRPTIADVDLYGVVATAEEGGFDLGEKPAIRAWKARIEALPGWAPAGSFAA